MKIPGPVEERVKRGRDRMREDSTSRNECLEFWRGNQYIYRSKDNILVSQPTVTNYDGTGKPSHRVRTTRNKLVDVVAKDVAAASTRVPAYEINPSTADQEDAAAANVAAKVAHYGYEEWGVRQATVETLTYAIVADGGWIWPFWDSSVGPYIQDEDGSLVGEGEVKLRVLGPNEVYWEPGIKFGDSSWVCVEQARPLDQIKNMSGFDGGKIAADAAADTQGYKQTATQHAKLGLVTEYLERPSPATPQGVWLTIHDGRVVRDPRPYPSYDSQGRVVDRPVLHYLTYIVDPDSDRDQGIVRHLLDAQRTINDATNKLLEWKNLALNPQVIIQNGEFKQRLTDEPGAVYHATGSGEIKWREVPQVPGALMDIIENANIDFAQIAAQNDIPSQVESGKGILALIERDQSRRADFYGRLATFHSGLMSHCLCLVARHYTEARLLTIRGRSGPSRLVDFRGADLRGQTDVTVNPGSLEPRSRAAVEQKVFAFADRGWIAPEAAMAAINGGYAESLVESYELDVAKANQVIQKIVEGPEALFATPPRPVLPGEEPPTDEMGVPQAEAPGWMPRPFDKIPVHKAIFEDWMKTTDYDMLPAEQKQAAHAYYAQLLNLEARQLAKQQAEQQAMAEQLGSENAAKPQREKPPPDQRKLNELSDLPSNEG